MSISIDTFKSFANYKTRSDLKILKDIEREDMSSESRISGHFNFPLYLFLFIYIND